MCVAFGVSFGRRHRCRHSHAAPTCQRTAGSGRTRARWMRRTLEKLSKMGQQALQELHLTPTAKIVERSRGDGLVQTCWHKAIRNTNGYIGKAFVPYQSIIIHVLEITATYRRRPSPWCSVRSVGPPAPPAVRLVRHAWSMRGTTSPFEASRKETRAVGGGNYRQILRLTRNKPPFWRGSFFASLENALNALRVGTW